MSRREGFHTATPYLIVQGAAKAIDYYKEVFEAVELMRAPAPDGRILHAEIQIGDSPIMLADESPDHPDWKGPLARGGSPVHIYLYVEDPDTPYQKAIDLGAKILMPLAEQPFGDRVGAVIDPFGHVWYIATSMRT